MWTLLVLGVMIMTVMVTTGQTVMELVQVACQREMDVVQLSGHSGAPPSHNNCGQCFFREMGKCVKDHNFGV